MTQPDEMDYRERYNRIRTLVDRKEEWVELYAREMLKFEPLKRFKLTARQRRVIAGLRVARELARLSDDPKRHQEPPPILGYDERERIVVQCYSAAHPHQKRLWALGREGQPVDIKGVVRSIKDNHIVRYSDG